MIRVAIVDDHMVVRTGLKYMIESESDFGFAGEWMGGVGAAEFVERERPDVTLLDVRMPDKGGIEALEEILERWPYARVVMLTTSDANEDVFRAIEEGAFGYVMKDSPIEVIAAAVRSAAAGEVFMTEEVRRIYETRKGMKGLSRRETEVLAAAAAGLGNREIGERLGISENSVKIHLRRLYFKLGVGDRTEAVTVARQRGILA